MRSLMNRIWYLLQLRRHRADLQEEMETHRSMRQERLEHGGLRRTDAAAASRRALGNTTLAHEDARDVWVGRVLESTVRDARRVIRSLKRSPVFATVTIATLALGIGATTVAYSLIHSVVLSPRSYRQPDRLVSVQQVVPEIADQYPIVGVNPRSFLRWRESCRATCAGIAALTPDTATLTGLGEPEALAGARVSPSLFQVLGVAPLLGRTFSDAETDPGSDRVAVLTHDFWQARFAGDPGVVGEIIQLDGVPIEIVGILPDTFQFPQVAHRDISGRLVNSPAYLRPVAWSDDIRASAGEYENLAIVRLPDGVTAEAMRAELAALTDAEFADATIHPYPVVEPLATTITAELSQPLWLLLGVALSALLIACVNVANLLDARWMGRQRELALRTAIGAGRTRLISLVVVESLVLVTVGGALGSLAAWLALETVVTRLPATLPRLDEIQIDAASLVFAATLTTGAALLCSLPAAWRAATVDPGGVLKARGRTLADGGRWARPRRWLVGIEVALTTMLLVVGGLLLMSFVNVLRVDPGFRATSLVGVDFTLPGARYPNSAARARFFDGLLRSLDEDPAIDTAALSRRLPLEGEASVDVIVPGGDARPLAEALVANHLQVSPGYLDTIGATLLHGRLLTSADQGRRVAVIGRAVARAAWPSAEAALGRTFTRGSRDVPFEVVGVVADVPLGGLEEEAGLVVYVPYGPGDAPAQLSLVARSRPAVAVGTAIERIRAAVRAIDPQLSLQRVRTLESVVDGALTVRRLQLRAVIAFAAVGLLLACIGIYGVSSAAVESRRSELAIRLALGASPGGVRRLVLSQGLVPVAIGLTLGLGLGVGAAEVVGSMLFGVAPTDPAVVAAVAVIMFLVAAMACLEPATRAARLPLASTLRA